MKNNILILLVLSTLFSCGTKEEGKPVVQDIKELVFASGELEWDNSYNLTAQTDGILVNATFDVGNKVTENQTIASIDNKTNENNTDSAKDLVVISKENLTTHFETIDKLKEEKDKNFEDWFKGIQTGFDRFFSNANDNIKSNEDLYREKLRLEAPADYWKKRATLLKQESKSYMPPSGAIDFTAEYIHDDKLVHYISAKNNLSLTSSYAVLDEYIRDIKNTLKTDQLTISGIGILKSDDGKISLSSTPSPNLNIASFGLPIIDTQSELLLGSNQDTYSLAQQALSTAMPDEEMVEEKRSVTSLVLMIIAVAIIASLAGLYYAKPNIYKNLIIEIQQSFVSKTEALKKEVITPKIQEEDINKADSIYNSTPDDIEANLKAQGFEVGDSLLEIDRIDEVKLWKNDSISRFLKN